ncbi:M28 family peptidase [Lunatimonas lonarensis]|nr:M28 family peptidase [Lunatimonas lonarensis]
MAHNLHMTPARYLFLACFLVLSHLGAGQGIDRGRLLADIRYLSSPALEGRAPLTDGSRLAQEFIASRFKELGMMSQYKGFVQPFSIKERFPDKRTPFGANIVGFIPGASSDKLILVLAHFDHLGRKGEDLYLGADDNASGVSALLHIAEYFSNLRPAHSMMFAAVDAEEIGMLGSKALVADFPFPLEQIALVVNMDMISRSTTNRLYAVGTRHYPQLKPALEAVRATASIDLVMGNDGEQGGQDWTNSSDHTPFHREGIPFVYFGVDDHKDYHKPTDTFENIDPEFFFQATSLVLQFLLEIDSRGVD